jgi:lipid A 4'-phosphatase
VIKETSTYRSLWLPDLLGILLLAAAASLPFLTSALDIRLLSFFHHPGAGHPWPHEFDRGWRALYTFGAWPALITALTGLGILVAALYRPALARWRRQAALIFLTLVLGPGLFVNTLFKDHWGRPRPRQVTELGGTMNYQCFFEKGVPGRGKSFPCGHSSMGYYFVVFYFLTRRRHRRMALAALAGALAYGTLIGVARMAAGAHFASDVLWSAFFPAAVAWLLYYVILRIPHYEDHPSVVGKVSLWRSPLMAWGAPPLAIATIAAVLLATPAFTEIRYDMKSSGPAPLTLRLHVDQCRVSLKPNADLHSRIIIRGEAQGFGWPWSRLHHRAVWVAEGSPVLDFTFKPKGHFSELDGQVTIEIPPGTIVTGAPAP